MTNTPELANPQDSPTPEGVYEIPESPEIPRHVEMGGVVSRPTQFTAQVSDDQGNQLVIAPAISAVTIKLPAHPTQLEAWSQGDADDALTGFAIFWIRLIKKALKFGWNTIVG